MPKIQLKEQQLTGQFRCSVDNRALASLDKAIAHAKQAGLVVDYRADVEILIKRLVKAINAESAKLAKPSHREA